MGWNYLYMLKKNVCRYGMAEWSYPTESCCKKKRLSLWHGWVIISYRKLWHLITYPCPNRLPSNASLQWRWCTVTEVNTLMPDENGWHFANDIFMYFSFWKPDSAMTRVTDAYKSVIITSGYRWSLTGGFSQQRSIDVGIVSMSWRHHEYRRLKIFRPLYSVAGVKMQAHLDT